MAPINVFLGHVGIHDAVQVFYIVLHVFEDAAYDTVFSAVDFDADDAFVFAIGVGEYIGGNEAVFEGDAGNNGIEVFFGEGFIEAYFVYFFDLEAGMCEFLCQFAIVGEQEDPGGVSVEAAYGVDSFGGSIFDEVQHRFAALWIFAGGDVVFWFI